MFYPYVLCVLLSFLVPFFQPLVSSPANYSPFAIDVCLQLDDMRADSPHPIILAPLSSGFNSHLTKLHYNSLSGSPAFRVSQQSRSMPFAA